MSAAQPNAAAAVSLATSRPIPVRFVPRAAVEALVVRLTAQGFVRV